MLEGLHDWFLGSGSVYALAGLFLILLVDSTVFPALPELFAVLAFLLNPVLWWALAILVVAVSAELLGNTLLYALVRKKRLPKKIRRVMKRWVRFLVLRDERILLVNRVAPVIPFTGAFIATCEWSYPRSMLYIGAGGLAKYSLLLALAGLFDMTLDRELAQVFTLVAIGAVICLSLAASSIYRRRLKAGRNL